MPTKINHHHLGQLRKKVERKSKHKPISFSSKATDVENEHKQAPTSCQPEKECAN